MSRYAMYETLGLVLEHKRLHENFDRDFELELYCATYNLGIGPWRPFKATSNLLGIGQSYFLSCLPRRPIFLQYHIKNRLLAVISTPHCYFNFYQVRLDSMWLMLPLWNIYCPKSIRRTSPFVCTSFRSKYTLNTCSCIFSNWNTSRYPEIKISCKLLGLYSQVCWNNTQVWIIHLHASSYAYKFIHPQDCLPTT